MIDVQVMEHSSRAENEPDVAGRRRNVPLHRQDDQRRTDRALSYPLLPAGVA